MDIFMQMMRAAGQGTAFAANQEESLAYYEQRIALFTARVEDMEAACGSDAGPGLRGKPSRACRLARRPPAVPRLALGSLAPISVPELSVGQVHKGRVLYCRTATRCMFLQSVAVLVEDSMNQLASLAVYNVPRVKHISEAQAWLPQATSLAIVEPFFKLRADGTPGIRVDDPRDVVLHATLPSEAAATAEGSAASGGPGPPAAPPAAAAVDADERLRQLAGDDSLGWKRIHQQLEKEGHSISQKKVRKQVADLRSSSSTAPPLVVEHDDAGAGAADLPGPPRRAGGPSGGGNAPSGGDPSGGGGASSSASAGGVVEGALPLQALVRVEGLQSEAGKALNGSEGSVADHDFAAGRLAVDIPGIGQKLIKAGNLRVLSTPSAPLPMPTGPWPSRDELLDEGRWLEALVLGQCCDSAFIPFFLRAFRPDVWEAVQERAARGSEGDAVFRLVVALVNGCRDAQALDPLDPWEIKDPSSILALADEIVASSSKGGQKVERVAALFFRGVLYHFGMRDYLGGAVDFRAAYVASEGHQPWILLKAGWCIASANEGDPLKVLMQKHRDAQVMYQMLLHHADRLIEEGIDHRDIQVARVFCLWELAQVLMWQHGWKDPLVAPMVAMQIGVLLGPGDVDELAAKALMERVYSLKDRALEAERVMGPPGIMNSLARDAVMHRCAAPRATSRPPQQPGLSGPKEGEAAGTERLSAAASTSRPASASASAHDDAIPAILSFMQMQAKEVSRMENDERDLRDGNVESILHSDSTAMLRNAQANERGARERVKALESKAEALAAREAACRRREAEQVEQRARWQQEAERMRGDSSALEKLYRQEQQQQAKDFAAETARLRAQHLAEVAEVRQQLDEVVRQSEREVQAAIDTQRQLELDLREAVGAKDSEAESWRRELSSKEEQVAFERESLAAQAAQLAEMQAELEEKRGLLLERDRQLRQEVRARDQLLAGGSLSKESLGTQRRGIHRVPLHKLKFSQDSIRATFQDGRSIAETTNDLRRGRLRPADLPTLRAVELPALEQIWSLDNRRLRCLKDAFPKDRTVAIDVELLPLSDKSVLAEFRRKWTAGENIQIRGGGVAAA